MLHLSTCVDTLVALKLMLQSLIEDSQEEVAPSGRDGTPVKCSRMRHRSSPTTGRPMSAPVSMSRNASDLYPNLHEVGFCLV